MPLGTRDSESIVQTEDPIRRLIDERVPWASHGSVFSRQSLGTGPALAQGWKLHVSATPSSAADVLAAALDVLLRQGARFKVVKSVEQLALLNSGHFGVSQIGKFITAYPSDDTQAVALATALDAATAGLSGPRVPSDRPLRPDSLVHYRYGALDFAKPDAADDEASGYDLLDPEGRLTTDFRLRYYLPPPPEVIDPFEAAGVFVPRPARSILLNERYFVVDCLAQGLRGGVFGAIDTAAEPARLCLLKEAWHDVSVDANGRDARDWLLNEEQILLRHADSPLLPRFYDSFELDGNSYLAIEYIEGRSLAESLSVKHTAEDGLDVAELVAVGRATAEALAGLHELGLVFRDLSPGNVIETADGGYRLIDFGTTYDTRDHPGAAIGAGTPPFYSREQFEEEPPAAADDVFAWGALLHYLACGAESLADIPKEEHGLRPFARKPVGEWRPGVPEAIAAVIDRAVAWERSGRYATMREAQHALARAAQEATAAPSRAPETAAGALAADPDRAFRDLSAPDFMRLARDVGDALCADAEEREDGLCWATRVEPGGVSQYDPDLYVGTAGIGLFLAELASATGEPRYAEAARGAARWLAGPAWGRGRAQHGLHCGEPGIGYFFVRIAELLGEPGFVTAAELRLRRLDGARFATIDVTHGVAGTLLALVHLHGATGEATYLERARAAGDVLVGAALPAPAGVGGCYWDVPPAAPSGAGEPYLGLLHGAAGIGLALARLADATGGEEYLDPARGAAELLLATAQRAPAVPSGADPHASALAWPRRLGDEAPNLQAHCHGAGGIGHFLLQLDNLTPDERYRDAARGAALTIALERERESRSCLCHGLAGTGHLMLDCYQALGESRWLDLARDCGLRLAKFGDAGRPGVYRTGTGSIVAPDLMLGYAGVGSLLLRLADPLASPELVLGQVARSVNERDDGLRRRSG